MRVGLYNTEPHIVNAAMMKVSTYHKQLGDEVLQYSPLFHASFDRIYCFSIFDFTKKKYLRDEMIRGGTGFPDLNGVRLPAEIEACDYDWSLYPRCKFSIIWFSIGCNRRCKFCLVPRFEGRHNHIEPKNLNPNGEYVKIMDNSLTAHPDLDSVVDQIVEWGQGVDIQGVDARITTEEQWHTLARLRFHKQVKIAWDNPKVNLIPHLERAVDNFPKYNLMCYVLIGFNSTPDEDLHRVMTLKGFGVDPFVMPYDKSDRYQMDFARWVNNKAVFKTTEWADYKVYT
jgi:hypothetical protein